MTVQISPTKKLLVFVVLILASLLVSNLGTLMSPADDEESVKAKRKTVGPLPSVIAASIPSAVLAPPIPPSGFSSQVRLGFFDGDQWELAIAADRFGHVYILYAQYYGVPGCDISETQHKSCKPVLTMVLPGVPQQRSTPAVQIPGNGILKFQLTPAMEQQFMLHGWKPTRAILLLPNPLILEQHGRS